MNNAFKKMTRALAWITAVTMSVWMVAPTAAAVTVYKYEWVRQSGTISADGLAHEYQGVIAGQTIPLSLTMLNRSGVTIKGKSALPEAVGKQVPIGVWGVGSQTPNQDGTPSFLDLSSFVLNNNRFVYYDGADVPNGGEIVFNWNIKMSSTLTNGTYKLYVRPVSEYLAWTRQVKNGYTLPSYNSDIFWQFVVGSGVSTTPTGGLSIALSPGTPASANVATLGNANFTKFTLTAAAGATVDITSMYIKRQGLTADADVTNIQILQSDGVQVGNTSTGFDSLHRAQVYFSPALHITGSSDYYIRAGFTSTATTGLTAQLGFELNTDIVSNATSVTGAPVFGNYMSDINVTIGVATVAEDVPVTDGTPNTGATNVTVNTFKIYPDATEDILVDRISVTRAGSASNTDTINIKLWNSVTNELLGTCNTWNAAGVASWPLNLTIAKGNTVRFKVTVDINAGVGLTVNADIAPSGSAYSVSVKGLTYGFYITPTASSASNWSVVASPGSNNLGQGDYNQTIKTGSLTISKSATTPAAGNITQADGQLLAIFDFAVLGEPIRISAVSVNLAFGDDVAYTDVTNAQLVDMTTGSLLFGPINATSDGSAALNRELDFTSSYTLPIGTMKVGLKVRVANTAGDDGDATADTITAAITAAGDVTAVGQTTGTSITAGGSYACTANLQTIRAGALVVRTLGTPPTGSVIAGASDFVWGTFAFDATAAGEPMLVTAVTITDTLDAATADMANIDNAELWADLNSNGNYYDTGELITSTEAPTGGGGSSDTHAFTFTKTITVPKGTSINFIFVADLATGAVADGTHTLTVAAGDATVVGAETGNDITDTASGSGGTLTVASGGTIASGLASSSPSTGLVVAGDTYATLGAFDFLATNEAYTIDTLTFAMSAGYDSMKKVKITYPTKTGTDSREVSVSEAAIAFSNINMYVAKNTRAVVTVTGTTKRVGTAGEGATFNDVITLVLDTSSAGEFHAVGEASGAAKTGTDTGVDDQTAASMYLYNTIPTLTATNSGTGTIAPGNTLDLYKFNVTADAAGAVAVKRFTFSIFITDASTTTAGTTDLGGFTFWRGASDITATSQITKISTDGGANYLGAPLTVETDDTNDIECNTSTWIQVTFAGTPATDATGEQIIEANQTVSYTLKAIAGTGFTVTDAFSTTLLNDSAVATAGYTYLSDADTSTGVEQIVILQNAAGTQYGDVTMTTTEQARFLWSDKSVLAHLPTFDDDGVTETSSADWTNGYLTKNTPSGYGYTL